MVTEHFYDSREAMFDALKGFCCDTLEQAINIHGASGFLVSGGSTPAPLYQQLAQSPLDWSKINVALVDERWVEPDCAGSNEQFIASTLLTGKAASAKYIPMKNAEATAKAGLLATTQAYAGITSNWDLTVLGMGNDGHTASIFPHCQGIEQALDEHSEQYLSAIIANPSEVTGDFLERMTLSLAGLLKSGRIVLLLTGEQKLAVYQQAMANTDPHQMPISAVLHQQKVPVHIYWAA